MRNISKQDNFWTKQDKQEVQNKKNIYLKVNVLFVYRNNVKVTFWYY